MDFCCIDHVYASFVTVCEFFVVVASSAFIASTAMASTMDFSGSSSEGDHGGGGGGTAAAGAGDGGCWSEGAVCGSDGRLEDGGEDADGGQVYEDCGGSFMSETSGGDGRCGSGSRGCGGNRSSGRRIARSGRRETQGEAGVNGVC